MTQIALVVICLLLAGCKSPVPEERTLPDLTVRAFVAAVAEGDMDKADSFFVREEMLKSFRPDLLYQQYSTSMRAEQLIEQFDADLFSYTLAWPFYAGMLDESILAANTPYRELTMKLAQTYSYESLKILDIGMPLAATRQEYFDMYAARAAIYGADDVTERIALTEYEGKTYLTGYTLVRYGRQWGIVGLTSPAVSTLDSPPISPITEKEYLNFFREE